MAAVERALEVVDRLEPAVRAWAHLDAGRARAEALAVDARDGAPLAGLVVGVKDVFDTADQPTSYGSPLFAGHRPAADAAAVALLRDAGAVCLGKTVTTELACWHPGPTTNPHRATHTPGGSSMGSAAAVATAMADVALGTQTAGSIVRPASFCGVFGFKPSYATVSVAGVKALAPSLDTVGWFSRDPELLDRVRVCLTGRPPATDRTRPPRVGVLRTEQWDECSDDSRRALEATAESARAAGCATADLDMPPFLGELADEHPVVMAYEAARSLAWEHRFHAGELSDELRGFLDWGRSIDPADHDAVLLRRSLGLARIEELFGENDVLLTPAVVGEAPKGLASTGDPRFARLWTLLGVPCVAVPAGTGSTGLPVGVQLVGRPGQDAELLATACWLAAQAI
ncbi:MAG TPA: amidase [Acidimicrobiales bacterium]|nr:amidase [Acidimicrobiales bacterium]